MKLIDKIMLAATGIGAVALLVNHYRPKPEQPHEQFCPFHRQFITCTDEDFVMHIANDRGYGVR